MEIKKKLEQLRQHKFWGRLIENFLSAFIGETGASGILVITTFVLVRAIGSESYGILALGQSYMTIIDSLINAQSWQAVIRFCSKANVEKDYQKMESYIKLGLMIDLCTAVVAMIVGLGIVRFVGALLGWSDTAILCSTIFCLEILFHFSGTSTGILRLFNKFNLVAVQKIVIAGLRLLVVTIACIWMPNNLILVVVSYVVIDIIGHLTLTTMALVTIRQREEISIRGIIHANIKKEGKKFFNFSLWTHLTSAVDVPVKQLDIMILSTISYEIIAAYKVYKQIGKILVQLTAPISQAIMPQFSDYVARGKIKECYDVVQKIRSTVLKIMLPITLIITIVSPWALSFLLGDIYGKYFYVLSLYLLSRTFALSYATIHPLFIAMGYVKKSFNYTIVANVIYLFFVIILSRTIGILGVVISLFIEYYIIITLKKRAIIKHMNQKK